MRLEERARAEELFHRLALLDSAARATALAEITSEDAALGAEIESLLAAHDSGGALDRLIAEIAPEPIGPHGYSPLHSDALAGTSIAQYEIGELIGRGGMGEVYRARDTKLGRDVALKFLPTWLSRDPSARDRFLVEARIVSSIDHTNVCALHDMGETTDGLLYLIMPYYEGETLKRRLADGPLPAPEAIQIALQMARGLAAAHERGVVHRDIKPSNVLLTNLGRVKLLDFGVAKLADVSLTRTGETPGTMSYMSPEQRTGGEVDARSDLWSLGAVLHEMLTGRRPATEPDGVAAALASVPRAVTEIVSRLLAAAAEERYPDAHSLAQDLAVLADGRKGLDARPAPSARRFLAEMQRRHVFRAAAVYGVLIVAAAWLALAVLRGGAEPAGGRARVPSSATNDAAPGIAVLPFRTVGDEVDELREGMVDLLSFNFDNVPGLRKIDPQSIITIWNRTVGDGQETNPATTVAVAETLGATYAVIGSAVQVGNQGIVRLGASVYDVRSATLLGSTQLEGRTDSLTALIDRLAVELLRLGLVPTDAGYPVPNLARATTASLPALKAYLAGEREYRQGRWFPAAAHFREAVELDSTFARAFYRLGSAMLSAGTGRGAAQEYLDRAATLAAGLPERDSLLLSGQLSVANIASGASESALRRLTTKYPDDADGWNEMGELRFHAGSGDFRSPAEYRNAFERATALAPHSTEPYMHLLDDAFARLDSSRVRSLLDASGMDQSRFCFRLVYDLRWGEDVDRRRARASLDTLPNDAFELTGPCTGDFVAAGDEVFEAAERAGLALLRPESPPLAARVALSQMTVGHLFRGEVRAARDVVARADDHPELRDVAALRSLALRMSPFSDGSAASVAHRLVKPLDRGFAALRNDFWLGLYAIDNARESDLATSLEKLETQSADDTATSRAAVIAAFPRVLRAYAALKQGDLDRLRDFEAAQRIFVGLFGNEGAFLRYDVGRLLLEARRFDDAERYFLSLYPGSWYYVPAQYQLGRVYEALGEREKAREHYRIFVGWWHDADPELQPWVEEGRARLARMGG